jgi:hypothetical protein
MATLLEQAEVGPELTSADLGRTRGRWQAGGSGATASRWRRSACSC